MPEAHHRQVMDGFRQVFETSLLGTQAFRTLFWLNGTLAAVGAMFVALIAWPRRATPNAPATSHPTIADKQGSATSGVSR